jgi:hypothetical protein
MSINRSIANLLGSVTGTGTEPTLTIGDGTAEDTKIVFDGHAQDYYIGLDDTDDDFKIGLGSTVGTTPHIVIDETGAVNLSPSHCNPLSKYILPAHNRISQSIAL